MAVGFFRAARALMSAHVRTGLNAALRDAGPVVTALATVISVGLWLVLAVAAGGLFFFLGWSASRGPPLTIPIAMTIVPVVAAFLSTLTGDVRALDWEKLKAYPVSAPVLFSAELVAGMANPFMNLPAVWLVALTAGHVTGGTAQARVAIPMLATSLALLVALRALGASLAGWIINRSRWGFVLLGLLTPVVTFRFGELGQQGGHADLEALKSAAAGFAQAASLLPAVIQASGGWTSASGVLRLVGPSLVPLSMGVLAYRLAFRELTPKVRRVVRAERLWSFRSPVVGLARLHIKAVFASEIGRFTAVIPVLWVLPVLALRARMPAALPPEMIFFSVWAITPTMLLSLALNQFGADRGAVKGLLLLPLSARTLLRGKALGLGIIMAANALALSPLTLVTSRPSPSSLPHGPLAAATVFLVQLAIGQFTSVVWPRPLPRKGLRQPPGGVLVGLVAIGSAAGMLLPLMGLRWLLADAPGLLTLALLGTCAGAFGVFLVTSRLAEQFLDARRERLVETLS